MKKLNYKMSGAKFTKEEIKMIKEIEKLGYIIEFDLVGGATIWETFKSTITGETRDIEICYASTIKEWGNSLNTYPLKEWHEELTKK